MKLEFMDRTIHLDNQQPSMNILKSSTNLTKDREQVPLVVREIIRMHNNTNKNGGDVGDGNGSNDDGIELETRFVASLKDYRYCPRKYAIPQNKSIKYIYSNKGELKITVLWFKVVFDDGCNIKLICLKKGRKPFYINVLKKEIYTFVLIDNNEKMYETIIKESNN